MILRVPIVEIFSSFQGEGPRVGERHTFVRLQDCDLSCRYCDSPHTFVENASCRVEDPPFSKNFRRHANPLSVEDINGILESFHDDVISVTGGEPLQKADFLSTWLPTLKPRFRVLLETAGVHSEALEKIIGFVDVISMDFKLPSATGMRPYWDEHEKFLKIARGKEVYVKAVVSSETTDEEIRRSRDLVRSIDASIPFILQPATAFAEFRAVPRREQIAHWQEIAQQGLSQVRIIPQVHKQLGIL